MIRQVIFCVEGVLVGKQNEPRPYFDVVLEYCAHNRIRVFVWHDESAEAARNSFEQAYPALKDSITGYLSKNIALNFTPDFVLAANNELIKKWRGALLPYYNPAAHNKFACLALAGRVLETIRDRVIRGLEPEPPKVKQEDREEPKSDKKDPPVFGIEIIRGR